MSYPFTEPGHHRRGDSDIGKDKPLIYLKYRLTATGNYYAKYIRGPMA